MNDPDESGPAAGDLGGRAADAKGDSIAANDGPSSAEYSVAFSPRQVAVGLAIVAGIVAVVAARHRRRRREG
jgi:hypothetical protein